MICRTVTLQSTGGRSHVNSCSLEQLAENTSQRDDESLKRDGEIARGKEGDGEETTGVEDCSPFAEVAGSVVTRGVSTSGSSPHESDGESEVAEGVKGGWDDGVADGLYLRDKSSKDDACLLFLLDDSNRHRRVEGIRDSCETVLSEVDDGTFRLGAMCEVFDLAFLRLRLHRNGDDFSVRVEPEEVDEATEA